MSSAISQFLQQTGAARPSTQQSADVLGSSSRDPKDELAAIVSDHNLNKRVERKGASPTDETGGGREGDEFGEEDDDEDSKGEASGSGTGRRFRPYQSEQWTEKFQELCDFRRAKGHCQVPHTYAENPPLARWVKRQRYQYKLKMEEKQSTMTDQRIHALEKIGFIWDSHAAAWAEKLHELMDYTKTRGNWYALSMFYL